jgi:hypothetical protein
MRRWWLGLPFCAGNPDTGSRRHRLASAGETIPRGTSTVPTGGKRIPCRSFRTQAGAAAGFLTDLSSIGLHPVLVLMLELIPGSSRTALSCGQIIYREIPKGNPMARDSRGALVALNRFGSDRPRRCSGDLISAASDPRGFVKAELTRAGTALLEMPGLLSTPALGRQVFDYQFEQQQARAAAAKSSVPPTTGEGPAPAAPPDQKEGPVPRSINTS